jgi:cytochrome P450
MKPYTFSNGVSFSTGEILSLPVGAIHMDSSIYENPQTFDGFRFSRMREQEGEKAKHHCVNTSTDYLVFGHGEHAWYLVFSNFQLIVVLGDFSLPMRSRQC